MDAVVVEGEEVEAVEEVVVDVEHANDELDTTCILPPFGIALACCFIYSL